MWIKTWRFITVLLVALSLGMAFCHLLQMAPRMRYDAWLWRNTQSMYQLFGPPLGVIVEGAAIVLSLGLMFLVRQREDAFQWTLICALCMIAAHAAWWLFVYPVNNELIHWSKDSIPKNWFLYRAQWEYTHAVRAIFQMVGFAVLVLSVLIETPEKIARKGKEEGRDKMPVAR